MINALSLSMDFLRNSYESIEYGKNLDSYLTPYTKGQFQRNRFMIFLDIFLRAEKNLLRYTVYHNERKKKD